MAFNPFVCPLPAALTTLPDTACPVRFDQIIAAFFYRKAGTTGFDATTILTSSAWTTALAATNNNKVVITPAFAGLTFPASEVTIEGENDNATIGGLGSIAGGNVIRPAAMFRNKSAAAMKALRSFTSESANSTAPLLAVGFINRFGQIITQTAGVGFDVTNVTVSDVSSEGLNRDNMHTMAMSLPYGWSDDYVMYTPSFNILSILPK